MRVNNGYNPYQYQQQKKAAVHTGFADLLAQGMQPKTDTTAFSTQGLAQRVERDNDTGFLSDPAIIKEMAKDKPVAANYPATLTEEQTDAIKKKYDIESMKWPSYDSVALGEELFSLGVIDDEQRKFFYGAVKFTPDPNALGIITPAGETPKIQHYQWQPDDSMIDILLGELDARHKNIDFLRSLDTAEKKRLAGVEGHNLEDNIRYMEMNMAPYQNMYDLLSRFM